MWETQLTFRNRLGELILRFPGGITTLGTFLEVPGSLKNGTGRIQEEKPDGVVTFEILDRS